MNTNVLSVRERTETGKGAARKLRRMGRAPAIAYKGGNDPLHFDIPQNELLKLLRRSGKNTLLTLKFEDSERADETVMLRELQREPIKRNIMHADFALVSLDEPVHVAIKLSYEGKPIGIVRGGIADVIRRELNVECLPAAIPDHISVDVTRLNLNQALHVSDIVLPEGVKALDDDRLTLVTIVAPQGMEDEEGDEEASA